MAHPILTGSWELAKYIGITVGIAGADDVIQHLTKEDLEELLKAFQPDTNDHGDWAVQVYDALPAPLRGEKEQQDWVDTFLTVLKEETGITETSEDDQEDYKDLQKKRHEFGLVLRFGNKAYHRAGSALELPSRAPSKYGIHSLDYMLGTEQPPIYPFSHKVFLGTDSHIDLEPGLTVVLSVANMGKTTFTRNLLTACLDASIPVGGVVWNERDFHSALGGPHHLVGLIEDVCNEQPSVVVIDSLREWALGGTSPGKGGINNNFFMNLTQWHHTFADKNIAAFAVINPTTLNKELIESITEVCRGSVAGILAITRRGEGQYEHVASSRAQRHISIAESGFKLVEGKDTPSGQQGVRRTEEFNLSDGDDDKAGMLNNFAASYIHK